MPCVTGIDLTLGKLSVRLLYLQYDGMGDTIPNPKGLTLFYVKYLGHVNMLSQGT